MCGRVRMAAGCGVVAWSASVVRLYNTSAVWPRSAGTVHTYKRTATRPIGTVPCGVWEKRRALRVERGEGCVRRESVVRSTTPRHAAHPLAHTLTRYIRHCTHRRYERGAAGRFAQHHRVAAAAYRDSDTCTSTNQHTAILTRLVTTRHRAYNVAASVTRRTSIECTHLASTSCVRSLPVRSSASATLFDCTRPRLARCCPVLSSALCTTLSFRSNLYRTLTRALCFKCLLSALARRLASCEPRPVSPL